MQKEQKTQYQDLIKKPLPELVALAKEHVSDGRSLTTKQESFKRAHSAVGKVIAAFKVVYAQKQDKGELPKGTSFRDYHKQVTGEFPNNHAEACANTFNGFVLTDLIAEQDYDLCAVDWLESASAILNRCQMDVGEKEVLDTIDILTQRPSDGGKQLRALKQALAPIKVGQAPATTDKEGNVKVMTELTPEIVSEILRAAFDKGFHSFVISELISEIQHISTRNEPIAKALFQDMPELTDSWDQSGVADEKLNAWMEEIESARAKKSAAPVAVAA